MSSPSSSGSGRRRIRRTGAFCATTLGVVVAMAGISPAHASPGQSVSDLTTATTATDLANALVGSGVSVSNVTYTGVDLAAGTFSGMGPVGFANGVVLGSGSVVDVVGPNSDGGKTTDHAGAGDADLNALAQGTTQDASVLEFDFVPATSQITFDYVFSSDEYNEFSNSSFNDVFAFLVNGTNCALTPDGDPVSINTINGGKPLGTNAQHPELFRNNELPEEGAAPIDIEPDGLTVVLSCEANVNQGVSNHMKLAIADTGDGALDSNVFLKAGSFQANHAPVATDGSATTPQDTAKAITLAAADSDGDALTYSVVSAPTHGTLSGTGANRTYTPNAGYDGPDSFTFKANDGQADSNVATFSLTVTPVAAENHAPVANDGAATLVQDTPKPVALEATDVDGDALTYSVVSGPAHGTLSGTGANRTYTPDANYNGPDSFTFKANDGKVDSNGDRLADGHPGGTGERRAGGERRRRDHAEDTAKAITLARERRGRRRADLRVVIGPGPRHAVGHGCEPHLHARRGLQRPGLVHVQGQRRQGRLQHGDLLPDGHPGGAAANHAPVAEARHRHDAAGHGQERHPGGDRQRRGHAHLRRGDCSGARHPDGHGCEPHLHADGELQRSGLVHLPGQRRQGETPTSPRCRSPSPR